MRNQLTNLCIDNFLKSSGLLQHVCELSDNWQIYIILTDGVLVSYIFQNVYSQIVCETKETYLYNLIFTYLPIF